MVNLKMKCQPQMLHREIFCFTCGQACFDGLLPVAEDLELWK